MSSPSALARRLAGWLPPGGEGLGAGAVSDREEDTPEGLRIEGRTLARIGPDGEVRPVASLSRCTLDGGRVEDAGVGLLEACLARGATFRRTSLGRVVLSDLAGATLDGVRIGEVVASSLHEARCTDTALDRLSLVDLAGAHLVRVHGVREMVVVVRVADRLRVAAGV